MKLEQTNDSENATQTAAENPVLTVRPPAGASNRRGAALLFMAVVLAVFGYFIYAGITSRARAEQALANETRTDATPTVSVVTPQRSQKPEEIVLPGNMQAFTDTPIYARTNGYLRRWYTDIGAHVTQGQLLAEIETPEVDQQLRQARADTATADANYKLSTSTAERWQFLLKTDSVSKQETDEKLGDLSAKKAMLDSAKSNLQRLQETQAFQKIYAPFAGVITARNVDVGALIDAGANSPKELFHLAATNKLRVYVNVPQENSALARPGTRAELTLTEFPDRKFIGTIVRTADAIDATSRTLLTEVDVENSSGVLLPGAFVSVHLNMPGKTGALTVPTNTLLFRSEGLRVAVVKANRVQLAAVTVGRDFGNDVEIVHGLDADDRVVLNPPDSIAPGTDVTVAISAASAPGGRLTKGGQ